MNMFANKDKFQYCAVDENGAVWLYYDEPYTRAGEPMFRTSGLPSRMIEITRSIPEELREAIDDWLDLNDWTDSVISFIEPVSVENAIDIISGHFKPQKLEKFDPVDSVNESKASESTLDISELSIEQLENLAERVNSRIKDLSTLNIRVNFPVDVRGCGYLIVDGDKLYRCKNANYDPAANYWRAEGGKFITTLPFELVEKVGRTALYAAQSTFIWDIRDIEGDFDLSKEVQLKVDAYNAESDTNTTV